ncbi:uncharacterized protein LOC116958297 isoform X3 [Petromyzon marinus]|uniref:uncharacterized protein LOC116958297 isoform X3 n=1 Tax=Petromyzon marinus TaxID=7757 RepID=UPI003F7219EC
MSAFAMLLLVAIFSVAGALRCKSTTEFMSGLHCCNKCHAGEYMVSTCTDNRTRTVCAGCPEGTFTAVSNYAKTCLPCSRCSAAMGHVTLQVCTPTQDTLCGCPQGSYRHCLLLFDCSTFGCAVCSSCRAEWEEITPCGDEMDTVCALCPEGFYNNGSSPRCRPCTRCPGEELSGCTRASDTICGPIQISSTTHSTTVTPTKGPGDGTPWWAWLVMAAAAVVVVVGMLAVVVRKSVAGQRLWCTPCREKILTLVPGCDDHRVDIIDQGLLDTPATSHTVTSPSSPPQQQQPQQQPQQPPQPPPPPPPPPQRREPPALLNRAAFFHAVLEAVPDGRFEELLRRRGLPEFAAAAARADHAGRRGEAKFAALWALGQARGRRWAPPAGRPGALPGRALVELSETLAGPMGIPGVADELWGNVEALGWEDEEDEEEDEDEEGEEKEKEEFVC